MKQQSSISKANQLFQKVLNFSFLFHVALWLSVVLILSLLTSLNGTFPVSFYFLSTLSGLPALILFSYIMDMIGKLLLFKKRNYMLFVLVFILLTAICSLLIPVLNHFILFGFLYPRVFEPLPWFNWRSIPQNLILLWFPFFILSIKTFFVNWFRSEKEKLSIENKRLLAEIQLMKIKLHPHFLFNTLNNLYAMSKLNCENSSEYILKLAEIYRTMLYECNQDFYPLNEELSLIDNYIELEKLRYDKRLTLHCKMPKQIDDRIILPPLLLFTFVENAFKHGCRHEVGSPFISIELTVNEEFIVFETKNSVPNHQQEKTRFGGIGLENTLKRLELVYENDYVYNKEQLDGVYTVFLKVPKLTKG